MNPYDVVANDFDAARLGFAEKRFVTATVKELPPGALILDLGCGSGQPITRYLTERGFAVIGVDSSRRMLALARKHVPRARLVRADIQWLALKASFHAIVAWDSLFHVAREHHPTVFRRCCQWLHPGGRLLVSLGGSEWEGMAPMFGKSFFYSGYAPETAIAQLEAAGLRVDFWEVDDATSRGHIAVVARKPA